MNAEDTRTAPPDGEFEPRRLRTITDMKRSEDDRLVGGVCAGAAKYLDIDPVIVRVVIAVLSLVGFAGVILYLAAWFLLPVEGQDTSIAADWFRLGRNEEQVRVVGLVVAAVLAAIAIVGDNGGFWGGAGWVMLPLAALFYLFVVRPRRRREAGAAAAQHPGPDATFQAGPPTALVDGPPDATATKAALVHRQKLAKSRRDHSWTLTWLTLSVIALAMAALMIYAQSHEREPWSTYVAVALTIVAVGLLVSTFFGNGGPLIGIGVLLAIALAIGSLIPNARIGQDTFMPQQSVDLKSSFEHGVGELRIDLTDVQDPEALQGRNIYVEAGIGKVQITVPEGVNVDVDAHLDLGEIKVFGRRANGTDNELQYDGGADPLTFHVKQRIGQIEVVRS